MEVAIVATTRLVATKSLDLCGYYSLGNLIHYYGSGKRFYYPTSYALPIITSLSL
jgi:hypothetical protein